MKPEHDALDDDTPRDSEVPPRASGEFRTARRAGEAPRKASGHLPAVRSIPPPTTERPEAFPDGRAGWLEAMFEGARDPIVATDHAGVIVQANAAMESLVGRRRGELTGVSLTTVVAETERRRLAGVLYGALRGDVAQAEMAFNTGRRAAFNVGPVRDAQGVVVGAVAVGRDVTDQRSMEEQFARADKLATVGRLAASVVHEVNNPLSAILVYADHLGRRLRGGGDPADVTRVERIGEAAARIQALVRRLLAYTPSPAEAPRRVSLGQVVGQTAMFCEHVLRERAVALECHVAPDAPGVHGVASELTQVLVNLVTNACHAAPTTGGRVEIEAVSVPHDRVKITVTDNGHGITRQHLERIFEPFFTTKGKGVGTGLGLAIVRTVIEQHGGEIAVASEVGLGTRFTITLPAAPDPAE